MVVLYVIVIRVGTLLMKIIYATIVGLITCTYKLVVIFVDRKWHLWFLMALFGLGLFFIF